MEAFPKPIVFFVVHEDNTSVLPRAVTIYPHYAPEDIFCIVANEIDRQQEKGTSDGIYAKGLTIDGVAIEAENITCDNFSHGGCHIVCM
jgi:hypothetical protein